MYILIGDKTYFPQAIKVENKNLNLPEKTGDIIE
jgi:hypothetical protein